MRSLLPFGLTAVSVLLASVAVSAQDRWIALGSAITIAVLILAQMILITRER